MKVKSLIITDDSDDFARAEVLPAEEKIQKFFPDYKLFKVIDESGGVFYINALYISSFTLDEKQG